MCNGQLPWLWSFQKIVTNSQLSTAKIPARKFISYTRIPDITDWNLTLVCISLKRNGDGCGTDLYFSDSKTNATPHLFSWPSRSWGNAPFFSPCPLYVLQSSSSGGHEGNRHKRCNKTHFTVCGWVKPYPAVPSCLCSCALLGGAKQLQWCGETDQRTSNSQLFTTDKAAAWTPGQVLGKNWFNLTGAPELPRLRRRPLRPLKKENKADRSHLRHSLSHASEGSCTCQPFTGSLVQTLSKRWPLPGICFREPHGQRLRKAFRKNTEKRN